MVKEQEKRGGNPSTIFWVLQYRVPWTFIKFGVYPCEWDRNGNLVVFLCFGEKGDNRVGYKVLTNLK